MELKHRDWSEVARAFVNCIGGLVGRCRASFREEAALVVLVAGYPTSRTECDEWGTRRDVIGAGRRRRQEHGVGVGGDQSARSVRPISPPPLPTLAGEATENVLGLMNRAVEGVF